MGFTKTNEHNQGVAQDIGSNTANDNHETRTIAGLAKDHAGLDPEPSDSTKQDADAQRAVRPRNRQFRVWARSTEFVLQLNNEVAVAAIKRVMFGATRAELNSLRKALALIRRGSRIRLVIDDVEIPKQGCLANGALPRWAPFPSRVPRKRTRH